MKISIVTISYNQVYFLKKCIDSVLEQNYPNLEYIVVDPGSSDGSRDLIDSYGDKIIRVYEKDNGPADGLNKGFRSATGDILFFLNSDDILKPGALRYVSDFFFRHRNIDVLMGCGDLIDANDGLISLATVTKFTAKRYLYGGISFLQQATFFRAEGFNDVGGFNDKNRICWDGELFLKMALNGCKFKFVSKQLGSFRIHGDAITGSGKFRDLYLAQEKIIFEEVMGRKWNNFDYVIQYFYKALRYVTSPLLYVNKIKTLYLKVTN